MQLDTRVELIRNLSQDEFSQAESAAGNRAPA